MTTAPRREPAGLPELVAAALTEAAEVGATWGVGAGAASAELAPVLVVGGDAEAAGLVWSRGGGVCTSGCAPARRWLESVLEVAGTRLAAVTTIAAVPAPTALYRTFSHPVMLVLSSAHGERPWSD